MTISSADTKKLAIIAYKGTLDLAYMPFILVLTAAAMDVVIFCFLRVTRKLMQRSLRTVAKRSVVFFYEGGETIVNG